MRISDWSSDVCSSDLEHAGWDPECRKPGPLDAGAEAYDHGFCDGGGNRDDLFDTARRALMVDRTPTSSAILPARPRPSEWLKPTDVPRPARWHRRLLLIGARSEEHTSELQSLMRISYAVFCLKKKKKNNQKLVIHSQLQIHNKKY